MTTELNRLIAENQWQDIKDAPKDSRSVLLTDGETEAEASWWVNEWMLNIGNNPCCHTTWLSLCEPPTHFRPLPDDRLAEVCKVLVEALKDLSTLGNAPHAGNSVGNSLAQHALAKAEEIAARGEPTND